MLMPPALTAVTDLPFSLDEVEGSIPDRFRRIAAHLPDQPAIRCGATSYTYGELDRLTDCVAGAVSPYLTTSAQPVALLFAPGQAGALLGLLSVLKAGGCYVAISPAFPIERQRAIWEDAQTALLLTDQGHTAMA